MSINTKENPLGPHPYDKPIEVLREIVAQAETVRMNIVLQALKAHSPWDPADAIGFVGTFFQHRGPNVRRRAGINVIASVCAEGYGHFERDGKPYELTPGDPPQPHDTLIIHDDFPATMDCLKAKVMAGVKHYDQEGNLVLTEGAPEMPEGYMDATGGDDDDDDNDGGKPDEKIDVSPNSMLGRMMAAAGMKLTVH
jgi:hypothetical protein